MSTRLWISSSSIANLLDFFDAKIFSWDDMFTLVLQHIFVTLVSPFTFYCDPVDKDDGGLTTIGNHNFKLSKSENTVFNGRGDTPTI